MARSSRPRQLHVCYTAPAGGTVGAVPRRSADEAARSERVDNVRVLPLVAARSVRPRAAVERYKLWENGRRLRVRYLDGDPVVHERVTAIAKEWEAVANLSIEFVVAGAAEIRIGFGDRGFSWSTVGTDALTVPRSEPTMNYGWLEPNTSQREYQRVVRHEFGHALGMIHEHQNPAALGAIPWDKPAVYAYYARQGWSEADVDNNIFDVYDADSTNFTEFDAASIMQYAVPDELTLGTFSIGWNTELSTADRSFMAGQYPQGAPGTVELAIGGPRHEADLSVGAEVDSYHFDVVEAATYIMTTEGASDVVLTLHGPNDPGAVFAWDDDLGKELNARLVRKLFPGSYWLSVRHKEPGRQGVYDIGIKRRRG